jgi:hypothetical protein
MGAAAVISSYDGVSDDNQQFVVHSPDGQSLTVQPVADIPDAPQGWPAAIRVSADAVTVVFGDPDVTDDVAASTLLVGVDR